MLFSFVLLLFLLCSVFTWFIPVVEEVSLPSSCFHVSTWETLSSFRDLASKGCIDWSVVHRIEDVVGDLRFGECRRVFIEYSLDGNNWVVVQVKRDINILIGVVFFGNYSLRDILNDVVGNFGFYSHVFRVYFWSLNGRFLGVLSGFFNIYSINNSFVNVSCYFSFGGSDFVEKVDLYVGGICVIDQYGPPPSIPMPTINLISLSTGDVAYLFSRSYNLSIFPLKPRVNCVFNFRIIKLYFSNGSTWSWNLSNINLSTLWPRGGYLSALNNKYEVLSFNVIVPYRF